MSESAKLANVHGLYLEGIRDGDASVVHRYAGERYTQHNTHVKDGKEGFIEFFEEFTKRNPQREIKILRSFVDGHMVFVQAFQNLNDGEAKWVTFDFFDTDENDKLIEHWDVLTEYSDSAPGGHTSIDGPTEISDLEQTKENKEIVRSMIQDVLMAGGDPENIDGYFSVENYIQHNTEVPDGLKAFKAVAQDRNRALWYQEIHHLVGSGNYVATLCRATWGGEPYAQADLYRLEGGLIVEHWEAAEKIPPRSEWVNTGKF